MTTSLSGPTVRSSRRRAIRVRLGRRTTAFAAYALLAASSLAVITAAPAAAIDCLSGYGSLWDGMASTASGPGGTYEGVVAHMNANYGALCDTGTHDPGYEPNSLGNFNYVYVMVAQNGSAGANRGYAQMGYYRGWAEQSYFTAEYRKNSSDTFHRNVRWDIGPLTYGGMNQYWVQWVPDNGGQFRMNIDLSVIDVTPWNPYSSTAFNPNGQGVFELHWEGETKYSGSDIPGSTSDYSYFEGMQVQLINDSFSGTLPSLGGVIPTSSRYGRCCFGNNTFVIYTN